MSAYRVRWRIFVWRIVCGLFLSFLLYWARCLGHYSILQNIWMATSQKPVISIKYLYHQPQALACVWLSQKHLSKFPRLLVLKAFFHSGVLQTILNKCIRNKLNEWETTKNPEQAKTRVYEHDWACVCVCVIMYPCMCVVVIERKR